MPRVPSSQHVLGREWGQSGGSLEQRLVRRTSVVFLRTLLPGLKLYCFCSLETAFAVDVYCRPLAVTVGCY